MRFPFFLIAASLLPGLLHAQPTLICNTTAVPPILRGEGIAERIGDIVLNCAGGTAGMRITGNLTIFLPTNITNRIVSGAVSGVNFTLDNGAGPQPLTSPGTIAGPATLVYNGLSFTLSATGTASLRIAGIRTAAAQEMLSPNASIQASLSFNSSSLVSLTNSKLIVGAVARSLYSGSSSKLVCAPGGSPLPDTLSFSALLASGAAFASIRVTEGFADALGPRSAWANLNADTGERIVVRYSGFPAGARLLVPDVVTGSDALQPTGGGDFGVPPSGGQYVRALNGSLLLARVPNADLYGAGGNVAFAPGPLGSAAASFDAVSDVPLTNGSGYAVYEVVDANPNVLEAAQFPTFLGLAPGAVNTPTFTDAVVTLAPVSQVYAATASDPIPRFQPVTAPNDCNIVGDCGANYFPLLFVNTAPVNLAAPAGGGNQVAYIQVQNQGGGVLRWNSSVAYRNGSGWLQLNPSSGVNNGTIRVDATPGTLAPGVYQATVIVDGGPVAGAKSVGVTFTVTAAPPPATPPPAVQAVVNAASLAAGPVAPGSLATIFGTNFSGSLLSVTFDGLPAQVLFANGQQMNVLAPPGLGARQSASVIVSVDGNASSPFSVTLANMAPAIFGGAVVNQDGTVNSAANPAPLGSVIQIFATGLSGPGAITAVIGGQVVAAPYYAGPAPGLVGVQQVNLLVPRDLDAGTGSVQVCGAIGDQTVCSPAVSVRFFD